LGDIKLIWFKDGELVHRVVESDDDDEKVNRSFGVFDDFVIKGGFCFFGPFAEVMLEDVVDDPSMSKAPTKRITAAMASHRMSRWLFDCL
jgi:hypothetical protein